MRKLSIALFLLCFVLSSTLFANQELTLYSFSCSSTLGTTTLYGTWSHGTCKLSSSARAGPAGASSWCASGDEMVSYYCTEDCCCYLDTYDSSTATADNACDLSSLQGQFTYTSECN
jgi:hypothetical protein